MFGKLNLDAFKQGPIEMGAGIMMILSLIGLMAYLSYTRRWRWLWDEWLTTLDPKKIGVMYIDCSFVMLFKGVIDAVMMRAQQAIAVGDSFGYLTATHFQQIFYSSWHNDDLLCGDGNVVWLMNLIIPLQIGARDVAFPFLNSFSFWLICCRGEFSYLSL